MPSSGPGPQIVRAWFDTVLNPIIRGLRTECDLLSKGNLTWRNDGRRLAKILPVREHIVFEAGDNLEQLLSNHPEVTTSMDAHDAAIQSLRDDAEQIHEALMKNPELLKRLAEARKGKHLPQGVSEEQEIANLAGYAAEYIINSHAHLYSYYSMADIWNPAGDEFVRLKDLPELKNLRDAVDTSTKQMSDAAGVLLRQLEALRNRLSIEQDVPIVDHVPA